MDEGESPRPARKENKMKKIISLLLILCCVISLAACGNTDVEPGGTTSNPTQSDNGNSEGKPSEPPQQNDEKLGTFSKNATLAETVMVDESGVKITATGLSYNNYAVELELTIENNSGKDLSFISGSMGYSCNSVNGYMVSDGYLNCDVANGKKANDAISFSYDALMLYGISEIADIEIGFDISDDDYNHTYTGPRQVKTSVFDSHDYSKDLYQETITSRAAMNTFSYDITYFSQDNLYNENGVKLLSSGLMVNRDGDTALLMELENTASEIIYASTSDIALNGLIVTSSTWSSDAINPGKRCIVDVDISSVLDSEYWEIYGIKTIGSISLSLTQRNSDGNNITEAVPVNIVVPNTKSEFDASGTEVYNANGLRIVSKTVLEDSSEYSADMYVLLLAENNSGKTLSIDDVYDSLSVNGFMTDYSYYSKELKNGESAVLEIKLWESSLEDNKISSVSDVKEVELSFEIKEGRNTIDTPVIKISFE